MTRRSFSSAAAGFSPRNFPYRRFGLAFAIGGSGGALFNYLHLPLPWMLGSMTACTAAALLGLPVTCPSRVRSPMTMIIGVLLGAGFSPDIARGMIGWIPSIVGLAAFVFVCGAACVFYFRKVAGFDPTTAYFSGMPGGLVEMVLLGEAKGGDARTIALVHSARILLVVFSLPFVIRLVGGVSLGARPMVGVSIVDTPLSAGLWLLATAVVGTYVGRLVRLPAHNLLGPMVASGVVHVLGLTGFRPPYELIVIAQVVLGAAIGCRFVGTPLRQILRILGISLGSTAILLLATFGFAAGLSALTGQSVVGLVLAYSPGGLTETSLVALALQIDVAFVATHHILRVFLVLTGSALFFKLCEGKR